MHVVSFLVDVDRYRDRVLMLERAAERVGRMTLLTGAPPTMRPASSALRIVPLSDRPRRRQWLQARLVQWWFARSRRVDILHDTQGFMLPLFAVVRGGPARLSSNFASTWDWFAHLRGRWPVEWRERELRYWSQLAGEWALSRVSDAFTVFGEGHRALFAETFGVPPAVVHALPNCVEPAAFSPDGPVAETGFAAGDPVLLFVGTAFRYKGTHELLEAVARLRATHPRVRLLMVGRAPDRAAQILPRLIAEHDLHDRVHLTGPVPRAELPGLMRACSALVLPSYTEGSPRVLIEAMACARPVVGTDIAGITALDPDGEALFRVPRCDSTALTVALDQLLRDPSTARARGRAGRARFLAHHTPTAAGDVLAGLYRRLAG